MSLSLVPFHALPFKG